VPFTEALRRRPIGDPSTSRAGASREVFQRAVPVRDDGAHRRPGSHRSIFRKTLDRVTSNRGSEHSANAQGRRISAARYATPCAGRAALLPAGIPQQPRRDSAVRPAIAREYGAVVESSSRASLRLRAERNITMTGRCLGRAWLAEAGETRLWRKAAKERESTRAADPLAQFILQGQIHDGDYGDRVGRLEGGLAIAPQRAAAGRVASPPALVRQAAESGRPAWR